jgi:hypothetical protein
MSLRDELIQIQNFLTWIRYVFVDLGRCLTIIWNSNFLGLDLPPIPCGRHCREFQLQGVPV